MAKAHDERMTSTASDVEWVTLVSKDDYHFVIDKRFALQSEFIRSMLGGGGSGGGGKAPQRNSNKERGAKRSATSVASETARVAASTTADNSAADVRMRGHATPPPSASAALGMAANGGDDPDGYVNPFAASTNDADDNDDDEWLANNSFKNGFAEAQSNVVHLSNIRGQVLETVVEYLCWNAKYSGAKGGNIPDFEYRIPPEIALEVLMAADYLNEAD